MPGKSSANKGQRAINKGPILFSKNAKLTEAEKTAKELAGVSDKLAYYRNLLLQSGNAAMASDAADDLLFGPGAAGGTTESFGRAELEAIVGRLEKERDALQQRLSAGAAQGKSPAQKQAGQQPEERISASPPATIGEAPAATPDGSQYELPPGHMLLEADWQDLHYQNGYISIRLGAQKWSGRFPVTAAKAAFNKLRGVYRFRGAPKLLLQLRNSEIRRILNRDVLDYYLRFLEQAEAMYSRYKGGPGSGTPVKIEQGKAYFSSHLPGLFRPECFDYLHRKASESLPIIALPELVINSDGSEQIHDSFLFPVEWKDWVFVVWESTETAKASYCFQFPKADYETRSRRIYDYLSGPGVNKRATLYGEKELRRELGLTGRVFHKSFAQWQGDLPFG